MTANIEGIRGPINVMGAVGILELKPVNLKNLTHPS